MKARLHKQIEEFSKGVTKEASRNEGIITDLVEKFEQLKVDYLEPKMANVDV